MSPWLIAIDTGGTFTDCLATSPAGVTRRVKVLSSSAIRARVVARPNARTIVTDWSIAADALAGCTIAPLLSSLDVSCLVPLAFPSIITHTRNTITLSHDLAEAHLPPNTTFEIRSPWQPPILAARLATATPASASLPPIHMRLATTRGTNALLERRGQLPALFITRGFGDLLAIGDQTRPDLFALDIIRPPPLHALSVEVTERLAVDGTVLTPLDVDELGPRALDALAATRHDGQATAAVALMHSWINPAHERAVAALLREVGFTHVCTSADLSPLIGFLSRTQSAVVNAYLSRVVGDYVAGVEADLGPRGQLLIMDSAGGLTRPGLYHPKDSLLSGPAGGLLGAAHAASEAGVSPPSPHSGSAESGEGRGEGRGALSAADHDTPPTLPSPHVAEPKWVEGAETFPRIITFDMGGTSTDVARCASTSRRDFPLTREHRVGDARILAPAVAVESVAAGGGSICSFHNGELRVGPESAGANPGPACYGAGGPLTITDCHLLLGRLAPSRFAVPLNIDAARAAALAVLEQVNARESLTLECLLEGFLSLADERMADAIRRISIRQGEDPATYALLAFGGAGGLHACALADRLSISAVLIPPDAGVLSARGLTVANLQRTAQRQILRCLDAHSPWLATTLGELEQQAIAAVAQEGTPVETIVITRRQAAVRVLGQAAALDIPADDPLAVPSLFADAYTRTFGHAPPGRPLEVESLLVVASSSPSSRAASAGASADPRADGAAPPSTLRLFHSGTWRSAPLLTRAELNPEQATIGPALLADHHATTFIPPGWSATLAPSGAVILRAVVAPRAGLTAALDLAPATSPIALELFIASLTAIAHDMGETLRRTALSVNVKERLDFSCALLSPAGELLVNAPHIPVHLGALGLCVRSLQRSIDMAPGDTIITNHPAYGGSHLPDITLVTPIHLDTPTGPRLIAYAASRAHHAEIGGIRPGSMPPGATRLAQEGVIIPPTHLVRDGVEQFDAITGTLTSAPFPTRALEHNLADLRAALAANTQGAHAARALFTGTGLDAALAHCAALTDRAESRVRAALARIAPGVYRRADSLDDGFPIAVTITIPATPQPNQPAATIDFTGTAPIHPQNFNATPAISTAAVLYVLRLIVNEPMPLNEGMLRAIDLRIPEGTLLNPGNAWTNSEGPAVAAGNVETSQRIVDVLLLALGLAAASQGTMNNLTFGNDTFGFYETICGGAGATPNAPGPSAVHTHMTNTRITDAEILEQRLPVRLRRFQIRRGSGGAGLHAGGDGVIREIEFLQPVQCSILAQRRSTEPPGLKLGKNGQPGRDTLTSPASDPSGILARIQSKTDSIALLPGSRVTVETPGGGGFGPKLA